MRGVDRLRASVLACLSVLLVGPVLAAGPGTPPAFRSGVLEPPRPAPDFTLRAHDGSTFRLARHRGDVVLLAFGYTSCPDVCPLTLVELAKVRARLWDAARRLRVAFVTVDPERDTVERLAAYVPAFDRSFVGLTGEPAQLLEVRRAYGVVAEKRPLPGSRAGYTVDHTAFVYAIDPEGRLRLMFPFRASVDDMTHDVKLLLGR